MKSRESSTRSRVLRSYILTTFKTRTTAELVEFLPILVARMAHEKTPKATIQEVVQQFLDYLEVKGVTITPELLALREGAPEGVSCLVQGVDTTFEEKASIPPIGEDWLRDLMGVNTDDGVIDLSDPIPQVDSPLMPLLHTLLDRCWLRSVDSHFPMFLWKDFLFEGQRYYAIASWKLHGEGWVMNTGQEYTMESVDWNLSAARSSGGVVYASDSTLLVKHEGNPVYASRDFNDFELVIPPNQLKSKLAGKRIKTSGSLFIWALKWEPGVEVRYWLNECIGGKRSPKGDLIRQSKIMSHFDNSLDNR